MSVSLEKTIPRDGSPALMPHWVIPGETERIRSLQEPQAVVPQRVHPLPGSLFRTTPTLQPLVATFLLSVSISSDFRSHK